MSKLLLLANKSLSDLYVVFGYYMTLTWRLMVGVLILEIVTGAWMRSALIGQMLDMILAGLGGLVSGLMFARAVLRKQKIEAEGE